MKKKKLIQHISILLIILLILCIVIIVIMLSKKNSEDENRNNLGENMTEIQNETPMNQTTSNTTPTTNDSENTNDDLTTNVLQKKEDNLTYFLLNECLKKFYDLNDFEDIAFYLIDEQAKKALNIQEGNGLNLENNGFYLEEIYEQKLTAQESIYVVKYKMGEVSGEISHKVAWIRVNNQEQVFSIYPYEYVSLLNQLDLGENDVIQLENRTDLQINDKNTYEINNLDTSTQACIKELFRRYKFDLLMDVEHLYQILNEEYRKERFPNFEDLTQYIHENKSDLYLDSIEEYNVKNYDSYVQYTGKGQEDKYYIFDIQNLMTYTLFMDNYTIVTIEEEYNAVLPNPQAKYCINRVIQAINDKNYEFVYEKLNPVLRNNYYRNREDFEEFIHNHFYDKNDYEIEEEYLIISSDVYQYNVKIIDATGQEISYKRLTMTVTLKENTDFVISITSG